MQFITGFDNDVLHKLTCYTLHDILLGWSINRQ